MEAIYSMGRRGPLERGLMVDRPNRFVVTALVGCRQARCYLPNPGRLWELLYPGVELVLDPSDGGATEYTVLAVVRNGAVTPLHTHRSNDLAAKLLRKGLIPGLEGAQLKRREVPVEESRFDLLIQQGSELIYGEVKCCTLFAGGGAYFPDAPSERACRHVAHLERIAAQGGRSVILILVNSPRPRWFMPDWHTDPHFAQSLLKAREKVEIVPLALGWNEQMEALGPVRKIPIPWGILEQELTDRGVLLALIESDGTLWGALEYCPNQLGRAAASWSRAKRSPKSRGEALRARGRLVATVPFRSRENFLLELKEDMESLLERPLDADGDGWLGRFDSDPRRWPPFVEFLLRYRFTRLDQRIEVELAAAGGRC